MNVVSEKYNIIYAERLTLALLAYVIRSAERRITKIYYFKSSGLATLFFIFLLKLKMIKNRPEKIDFHLSEIRNFDGSNVFTSIINSLNSSCSELTVKMLNNVFVNKLRYFFDEADLSLFLKKLFFNMFYESVVLIFAAEWHLRNNAGKFNRAVYCVKSGIYSGFYEKTVQGLAIETRDLPNWSLWRVFFCASAFCLMPLGYALRAIFRKSAGRAIRNILIKREQAINSSNPWNSNISFLYMAKSIHFEKDKRSDFFWLLNSKLPRNNIIVNFYRKDIPISKQQVDIIKKEGLKMHALGSRIVDSTEIPVIKFSLRVKLLFTYLFFWLSSEVTTAYLYADLAIFRKFCSFLKTYSFWLDYFQKYNISINYYANDGDLNSVAVDAAMRKLGGVSVSNQFSNLWFNSYVTASGADVLFSFSPSYQSVWKETSSTVNTLVFSGYPTDHAFAAAKSRAVELRKNLTKKGADYIICFLDENSSDDPMCPISNKTTTEIYEYFFQKLLNDNKLGIIFKPGYPKTIFSRISQAKKLIEDALKTGRCIFLDEGSYVTDIYPCEAAMAADLTVGLLFSGTAILEAYLSGVPAVFLDKEDILDDDIYKWGRNKAVFNDIEVLFDMIQKHRANDRLADGFGDIHRWADGKDPYKDGRASERIGSYLESLYNELNNGDDRLNAINKTNITFSERWGKESISQWR